MLVILLSDIFYKYFYENLLLLKKSGYQSTVFTYVLTFLYLERQ